MTIHYAPISKTDKLGQLIIVSTALNRTVLELTFWLYILYLKRVTEVKPFQKLTCIFL